MIGSFPLAAVSSVQPPAARTSIRVVMDDNYPPYIFRDSSGALEGILVDQWALWEQKTGIQVRLEAMAWAEAQRHMLAGDFDVIDTIFENKPREALYDFSAPYAQIEVPIFFSRDLGGIRGPRDLAGFIVGAKEGDSSIEVLKASGVTTIKIFNSYEDIVAAAKAGRIKVFTVDQPPALYYLIKLGIQDQFRATAPLYTGAFHRAVRKGDKALLAEVQRGFDAISRPEFEALDRRWYGTPILSKARLAVVAWSAGGAGVLLGLLLLWVGMLRRSVKRRTAELLADIAERRQAEEALGESLVLNAAIVDSTADLIWSVDPLRFGLMTFNQGLRGYFLQHRAIAIQVGMRPEELFPPGDYIERWKGLYRQALERGSFTVDYAVYARTNILQLSFNPLLRDGKAFGVSVFGRDVTEGRMAAAEIRRLNRDLEQRVQERTAQLEDANRELEAFSYSVSHDLRAPLRSIDGFTRALMEDHQDQPDADGKPYLARIQHAARRMGQLIDDLLKLSRTSRSELTVADCDLSRLCLRVAGDLAELDPGCRVEVRVQEGMTMQADPHLMRVVLENLLGNAWKFTSKRQAPRIEAGEALAAGGERAFFIRDNGAGFDMAMNDRLFRAFQRLHSSSDYEGSGIGLAIVQRIIHRHGGRIWAEGEPGVGATFFFTLPPVPAA